MGSAPPRRSSPLLSYVGAAAMGIVVLVGLAEIFHDYTQTQVLALRQLDTLARIAAQSVADHLAAIDTMLQEVDREIPPSGTTTSGTTTSGLDPLAYIKARAASQGDVRTLALTDARGRFVLTTHPDIQGFDAHERPYYTAPLAATGDRDRLFLHGPLSTTTGTVVIFASRARRLPEAPEAWAGVVVASLPPPTFTAILDNVRPDGGFAALMGADGTLIAYTPGQERMQGRPAPWPQALVDHLAGGQTVSHAQVTHPDGAHILTLHATPHPALHVAVGVPMARVLAPWVAETLVKTGALTLLMFLTAITLRRIGRHETDLLAERNFARQVVETANVLVVGLDREGRVRLFNEAAEALTGYPRAALEDRTWFDLILPPEEAKRVDLVFRAYLAGDAPLPREADTPLRTRSGEIRLMSWRISAIDNHDIVVLAFGVDMTDRVRTEAALSAARQEAESASRAKSAFLANMSHEIRTPLNAVLGLSHLLEHSSLSRDQRDCVAGIASASRTLLSILNDILDFSRIEAGRLTLEHTAFSLHDVLDAVSTLMSVNANGKDLDLMVGTEADVPTALIGDPLRLQQILINLTGNALKFTETGEVALLVSRAGETQDRVRLRFLVEDTGIGIAAHALPTLFDAFSQADSSTTRRYGGSGLGLAITRRLVEVMGGTLGVESTQGQGSRFWADVPFEVQAHLTSPRPAPPDRTLLLVAPHARLRGLMATTAAGLGWRTEAVATAEAAQNALLGRAAERPSIDAVVIDASLPDDGALPLAMAIRALPAQAHTPILVMATAFARASLTRRVEAAAIDAVALKPVTASSLARALSEAEAHHRASPTPRLSRFTQGGTEGPRLGGIRVLVAEDNPLNQEVARRVLDLEGASTTLVGDGREALTRLAATPQAFDVVLMDTQMPVMDGTEATRRLRHDLGLIDLPVIALTAGAFESDRQAALAAGMNDYIAKPFDIDHLVDVIRRTLPPGPLARPKTAPLPAAPLLPLTPVLPGIDALQAALRLGGDQLLYLTLLEQLAVDFSEAPSRARELLEAGQSEEAARVLHRLRGATATLGATEIATLSSTLEALVRDGRETECPALLERLEDAMRILTAAIAALPPRPTA